MNRVLLLILLFLIFLPFQNVEANIIDNVRGKILLDVEKNGEAWYIYPEDDKRYYLGRPDDAFNIMRELGLGISNSNLEKIPEAGSDEIGDSYLKERLLGKILLQVENHGEAWYVYPGDAKRYYLGRPADAFRIMRELGLGITSSNLAEIMPADSAFSYEQKIVSTSQGDFTIDMLIVDLSKNIKVITDTANLENCDNNCSVKSLADYVLENNGLAAIHGSYFCPSDYSSCLGKINSYFYPVLNSETGVLINENEIKWLQGSILVFDENNEVYLFPHGPDFISMDNFRSTYGKEIQALISNSPALIHNGENIVASQEMDSKQQTTKGYRGGIGIKDKKAYLIIAHSATVPDLASIMESLGMEEAMNLDGGGSSALYYNNSYKVGPGRLLPNALIFGE